jgi:hypothetical protein
MVFDTIREHGIAPLSPKRQSSGLVDPNPQKKPKIIKYNREQVRKCIMDGRLGPVPRFPDKSFKCLFHLKCHIVDTILNNLDKYDLFRRRTICRVGKPAISPYVKFLCAQKMLCYGVSASAFIEYFRMGHTTSRRCLSKLTMGMVCCCYLATSTSGGQQNLIQ